MIAGAVLIVVMLIGAVMWHNHIQSECAAMGGHVKWLYGGKNQATNYLCLSKDGRILG